MNGFYCFHALVKKESILCKEIHLGKEFSCFDSFVWEEIHRILSRKWLHASEVRLSRRIACLPALLVSCPCLCLFPDLPRTLHGFLLCFFRPHFLSFTYFKWRLFPYKISHSINWFDWFVYAAWNIWHTGTGISRDTNSPEPREYVPQLYLPLGTTQIRGVNRAPPRLQLTSLCQIVGQIREIPCNETKGSCFKAHLLFPPWKRWMTVQVNFIWMTSPFKNFVFKSCSSSETYLLIYCLGIVALPEMAGSTCLPSNASDWAHRRTGLNASPHLIPTSEYSLRRSFPCFSICEEEIKLFSTSAILGGLSV